MRFLVFSSLLSRFYYVFAPEFRIPRLRGLGKRANHNQLLQLSDFTSQPRNPRSPGDRPWPQRAYARFCNLNRKPESSNQGKQMLERLKLRLSAPPPCSPPPPFPSNMILIICRCFRRPGGGSEMPGVKSEEISKSPL